MQNHPSHGCCLLLQYSWWTLEGRITLKGLLRSQRCAEQGVWANRSSPSILPPLCHLPLLLRHILLLLPLFFFVFFFLLFFLLLCLLSLFILLFLIFFLLFVFFFFLCSHRSLKPGLSNSCEFTVHTEESLLPSRNHKILSIIISKYHQL